MKAVKDAFGWAVANPTLRGPIAQGTAYWYGGLQWAQGVPQVSQISDRLYLGNIHTAHNLKWLESAGITHIVAVTQFGQGAVFYPGRFRYHPIEIYDVPQSDLGQHFRQAADFIRDAFADGGKVYVHCNQGRSRSASVVIAYYIAHQSMAVDDALRFVRDRRVVVEPNEGFMEQLRSFERRVRDPQPADQQAASTS
eukprot:TRINITY_DN27082_c0_g1_i1.p3 TRINITY_DN27082_c0_g1~~TRINITY_DN27082_c0_g1_i1.p3  ORF type:complete len:196 (+),score=44.33 TRINITY_DN27082_c0_g1_i1:1004-1591(+)